MNQLFAKTDHIGYLTADIEQQMAYLGTMGYVPSPIYHDERQKAFVCFMEMSPCTRIELVQPYKENTTLKKMLKGEMTLYHVCYVVEDIEATFHSLVELDFIPLFSPVGAIAFGGRRICYFWSRNMGYVEIVEKTINK